MLCYDFGSGDYHCVMLLHDDKDKITYVRYHTHVKNCTHEHTQPCMYDDMCHADEAYDGMAMIMLLYENVDGD